jgi:hypothetical protein
MSSFSSESLREQVRRIDDQLSRRPLELDPAGYFVIYVGSTAAAHLRQVLQHRDQ